ncbi:HEAT repeat protein, partial [Dictyocaulus viviparus]
MIFGVFQLAAVLVIAQCLARHDGKSLISETVYECVEHISKNSENILAYTVLICAIFKHVDRQHLLVHVPAVRKALTLHFPLEISKKDTLTRKIFIKLVQRLALVVLKPKRGRRRLEENLRRTTLSLSNGQNFVSIEEQQNSGNIRSNEISFNEEVENVEQEDYDKPSDLVEWAIDCVLHALSDDHTMVRWSAAKGVGRITSRLSKEFATQVISRNFHRLAGHCSWHGGCLSLAELSRRGSLQPEALDKVFPIIQQALFYEEPMGGHAFGSNVRDAACYVLWAFARAYEPRELMSFIETVATNLICVALFDREVNLRRAASAAFQENVGRQAHFPNGIDLLTIVDYLAVGNRWRCYTKVCIEVISFPKYADSIIDHLINKKVHHWDKLIREQAAVALGLLAPLHSSYVLSKLEILLNGCSLSNPLFEIHRHGYLLALSHCLKGLLLAGYYCDEDILHQATSIPRKLLPELEKPKILGGELTRLALSKFIYCLAAVPVALDFEDIIMWQERIVILACDDTAAVRSAAALAASTFFPSFFNDKMLTNARDIVEKIARRIVNARRENERIGLCSIVAFIPPDLISSHLIQAICNVILKQGDTDAKWALGRRAAVDTLGTMFCGQPDNICIQLVFDVLFRATEDYTTDCHGDIGRLVTS